MRRTDVLLVLLPLFAACATPTGEGRLVRRLTAAVPERWPSPVPVGQVAGPELNEGALTDAEAAQLSPACRTAFVEELRRRGPVRDENPPGWRVVISRLVVDTQSNPRGERMVRARAVAEIRIFERPIAVATGLAHLVSRAPSFRADNVEPREVDRTVRRACLEAVRGLLTPFTRLDESTRAALHARARSSEAGERVAAVSALANAQDVADGPVLLESLRDAHNDVRRFAALGLGEMGYTDAAEALALVAETDVDYAVRLEAVASLNKLLVVHPKLKALIREARARGAAERAAREKPAEEVPAEDGPSRVIETPVE